jgi:phage/plasmid-associated DNA primase
LRDKYVCALSDGRLWYYFDGSLWKPDKSELRLRHELSTTINDHFYLAINQLSSTMSVDDMQSEASSMKKHRDVVVEKLMKICGKLQDSNFKNHMLSEMREYFYDDKFMENLDNNPDIIAFTNGVWDLRQGAFRSSTPEDNVSLSVGYDFSQKVNEACREKIKNYWKMMHPNEDQRNYVIKMFARQLYGDNGCNLFHVHAGHQGSAGNGKTKFFDILERFLGDYVRKFGVEFLTAKDRPDVGKAMPEYHGKAAGTFIVPSQIMMTC